MNAKNSNSSKIIDFFNQHFWFWPMVISILIYLATTRHGIGLSPDSIAYYGVEKNLSAGLGISLPYGLPPNQPLTQFPPLLSILIFLISTTGFSTIISAKLLNLILIISFVFLSFLILKLMDHQSSFFRSFVLGFIAMIVATQYVFNMLWSEPLMIVLGLGGLILFFYSQKRISLIYSIFAGLVFALTVSTRYAGITFLITALVIVFLNNMISWKRKLIHWFFLVFPSSLFLYIWMTREIGDGISTTGRTVSFHPINLTHIHQLLATIASWFQLSNATNTILKLLVFLIFAGFILILSWKVFFSKSGEVHLFEKILVIFIYTYLVFIFFSLMFLDANIPLDNRILSPVLVAFSLLTIATKKIYILKGGNSRLLPKIFTGLIPLLILGVFINNFSFIKYAYQNGIGFNSLTWKNFDSIQHIKELPGTYQLVSNAPEPVFYFTNHAVYSLPKQYFAMQQEQNPNYELEMKSLSSDELNEKTYFIFFHEIKGGSESEISSLQTWFYLEPESSFEEASIFSFVPRN